MTEDLHLTPLSILPPITPEDNEFALLVKNECNLPFDELCWLIRDIRDNIQDLELKEIFDEYKEKYYEKLEVVNLNPDDPLFNTFNKHLKKIKIAIRSKRELDDKFINKIKIDSVFFKLLFYLRQTSLIKIKKHVVFGLFIIHFKLYKKKPYKNKKEWTDKPTADDNWENYIYGIVKNRLKKYSVLFT